MRAFLLLSGSARMALLYYFPIKTANTAAVDRVSKKYYIFFVAERRKKMKRSYYRQLETRVRDLPLGAVFAVSDFSDIASPKTVSKMLTRLAEKGTAEKLMRGIFWKPDGVRMKPSPNDVAEALARENSWDVAPSGDTALYLAGLSADEPGEWTYVTNGTYRSYRYQNARIRFTHTKAVAEKMSARSRLLVQCIKAFGRERLTEETQHRLVTAFRDLNWMRVREETRHAAAWICRAVVTLSMIAVMRKLM